MISVGQLSVTLGLLVDKASWKKGDARINHFRRVAAGVGVAMAGVFAGRALGKAFLGFNMSVEESKNQIASMLALGGQTTMTAQLENANKLYDMLRVKAADLPGETQDYVNMLGLLAQPLSRAGASLEAMRDITAGSFVLAKGMGISWQEASRDLRDYINQGKVTARDKFLLGMLQGSGVDTNDIEKARAQSKKLGYKGRAALIQKQTTGPLAQEVAERLSKSFSGRLENVKENLKQTFGKIGSVLFEKIKVTLTKLADWFKNNKTAIGVWAEKVGKYIGKVFDGIQTAVMWLLDHQDVLVAFFVAIGALLTMMMGRALLAWFAIAWPMFAGAGLFLMFTKVFKHVGLLPGILLAAGAAGLLMWLGIGGPVAIAVIALAAFAAVLYVWKDEVVAIFDQVKDSAKDVWDVLNNIPVIGNLIGAGKLAVGAATGNASLAEEGAVQSLFGGWGSEINLADPMAAYRQTPTRDVPGSGGTNVSVTGAPTTFNVFANDAKDVGSKIKDFATSYMDEMMRTADRAAKGNKP